MVNDIKILECKRCGYTWPRRRSATHDPVTCPNCMSPYWNKERVVPVKKCAEANDK
jgi:predicted Zn-ribbon and HTH transcriptional regulator